MTTDENAEDDGTETEEDSATPTKKAKKRAPAYKTEMRKTSVVSAIEEANGEREALAEEMRGWVDNMEEKFSTTSRFEAANSAADALEGIDEVDTGGLDDDTQGIEFDVGIQVAARKGRGLSRATRAGNVASLFGAVAETLTTRAEALRAVATEREEIEEAKREKEEKKKAATEAGEEEDVEEDDYDGPDSEELNNWADLCEECAQACEQARDELEGVEFPGMFG